MEGIEEMSNRNTALIIDDDENSLFLAKELLKINGFNTIEAENADTGIQLTKQCKPDVILIDLNMPVKTGYDVCLEIKSDPKTKDIPLIAFTAMAMETELIKALECGFNGIITKPFDTRSFATTVNSFILNNKEKLNNSTGKIATKFAE